MVAGSTARSFYESGILDVAYLAVAATVVAAAHPRPAAAHQDWGASGPK